MGELTLFRALARAAVTRAPQGMTSVSDAGHGWHQLFSWGRTSGELDTGDWQRDRPIPWDRQLAFFAVYACITQIAADLGKLCVRLMEEQASGIYVEIDSPAFSPFLRKPNHFQTMQQFVECWEISKLSRGNTLALKERDARSVVVAEYVLDWDRVTPLIAPDGSVFYQLMHDDLSHLPFELPAVPASEVIHDRMNCLFHPLIGVSPLHACGLAARQGLEIQGNSAQFFANMSRPSGVLSGPKQINDETAARLKREWEGNFGKGKIGKVAVLGDALKYEPMAVTPVDAALVDQLKLSAEQVCSAYSVPKFMIGIGDPPSVDNVQALTQFYYDRCLHKLIKAFQDLQDEGLGLPDERCVMFNLDDLLLMDSKTKAQVEGDKVRFGISAPNESRLKFDLPPVAGGKIPYLQQQNFSLEALAKRDAQEDPFKSNTPAPPAAPKPDPAEDEAKQQLSAEVRSLRFQRALERKVNEALHG